MFKTQRGKIEKQNMNDFGRKSLNMAKSVIHYYLTSEGDMYFPLGNSLRCCWDGFTPGLVLPSAGVEKPVALLNSSGFCEEKAEL